MELHSLFFYITPCVLYSAQLWKSMSLFHVCLLQLEVLKPAAHTVKIRKRKISTKNDKNVTLCDSLNGNHPKSSETVSVIN